MKALQSRFNGVSHKAGRATRALQVLLLAATLPAPVAVAQTQGVDMGVPESSRVGKGEPVPAEESPFALPYSQILRDTEPPYESLFRNLRVGGMANPKIGSADALFNARLFSGPMLQMPLMHRGLRPEDAALKIGCFYLDPRQLSGSVLFSDNVNFSETDREAGVIGIVRLTGVALLQIRDNLRLSVACTLVWLPFEGEIGVAGFGIDDPVAQFEAAPLARAQLVYDFQVGQWDVELYDALRSRYRRFGESESFDLFDGERFDEEDRAGRYVYRDTTPRAAGSRTGSYDDRLGTDYIEIQNLIGASVGRMLPTDTRFEFGGYHSSYFYRGNVDEELPASRDTIYALLTSERETMRFKPFGQYRIYKNENQRYWDQEYHAGIHGPITENLMFLGRVGYLETGGSEGGEWLWTVRLRHNPGPLTYHQLEYRRGTTEPDREVEESLGYRLSHIFRKDLIGSLYAIRSTFNWPGYSAKSGEEDRAGVRFAYDLAQRTVLIAGVTYTLINYENYAAAGRADSRNWTVRGEIRYRFKRDLLGQLIYQYYDRDSSVPLDSYYEHLIVLTLRKNF